MNRKMMKTAIVFLIFALTTGSTVLASTARQSLLLFSFRSQTLFPRSLPLLGEGKDEVSFSPVGAVHEPPKNINHPPEKGERGGCHYSVISSQAGIQFLVIPVKTGIQCLHLSNIQSIPLKIRGRDTQAGLGSGSYDYSVVPSHAGIQSFVIPTKVGIQSSVIPIHTRIQKIRSVHRSRRFSNPDTAIIITNPPTVTFNYASTVSIQTTRLSSNTLSDIFIPPK
jgi:hypothetical protein